ncbi:hypothetical protein ACFFHF_13430 [Robertmurraya beringensis]|uniref:Uncharacterized protein n=1 Tax=Robertmurraya beringensis TaxID=641660 RepID=A0ABV6KSE0_9BACI
MKKTLITVTLAAALIVGGGTGLYYASAKENVGTQDNSVKNSGKMNTENMDSMMNGDMQEMMDGNMQEMMNDKNMNFGQMKDHMKEMHPELTEQQLEEMYKDMHGTGGSENSNNFQ